MPLAHPSTNLADIARPFAWIAAMAFLTGFLFSLALHRGRDADAPGGSPVPGTNVVGPAPQGAGWDRPKAI
jgi:hypothetical protein